MKEKKYYCDKINSEEDYKKFKKRFIKVVFIVFTVLTIIGSIICKRVFAGFYTEFSLSTSIICYLSIVGGMAISLIILAMYMLFTLTIVIPISSIHKKIDMRRNSKKYK